MTTKSIVKADKLRKKVKLYEAKSRKVLSDWDKKTGNKEASEKFSKKLAVYEKKMDVAYGKYYTHVNNNFGKDEIVKAGAYKGKFLNKSFITNLAKKGDKTHGKTKSK